MSRWLCTICAALVACDGSGAPPVEPPCAEAACRPELADWTCRAGFAPTPGLVRAVAGAPAFSACAPPAPVDCPEGQAWLLPAAACAPLGAACPTQYLSDTEYRAFAPAFEGAIVRVAAGGSIQAALDDAPDGGIVALAAAAYDERLLVQGRVALVGACPSGTLLAPAGAQDFPGTLMFVGQGGGHVANLGIRGARPGVWAGHSGEPVSIESIDIRGVAGAGLVVSEGPVRSIVNASRVVVRGTTPAGAYYGWGVFVGLRAELRLASAALEGNSDLGIFVASQGSSAALSDLVVRDTLPGPDGFGGGALMVIAGTVSVEGGLFSANTSAGVGVNGAASSVRLMDLVIEDTLPQQSDRALGMAMTVRGGAYADLARVLFRGNRMVGLRVGDDGSSVTAADLIVRATQVEAANDDYGWGISLHDGSSMRAERLVVEGNSVIGVAVAGEGTLFDAGHLVVTDTRSLETNGLGGTGLAVWGNAMTLLRRAILSGNRGSSLMAVGRPIDPAPGLGATLIASDVTIEDTAASLCGELPETDPRACWVDGAPAGAGVGVYAAAGGSITLSRFDIARSRIAGFMINTGGQIAASNGVVRDNPIGINVQDSAYDLANIADSVRFEGNLTKIDASLLPVPDLGSADMR